MSTTTSSTRKSESSQMSVPVVALTSLGVLIAVLGLFAAGDMMVVSIGLAAIFGAGLIELGLRLGGGRSGN